MICEPGDVAVVPFPFAERPRTKRRPALALSSRSFKGAGHTVFAMITTKTHAPWPGDVAIEHLDAAGLSYPCIVRLKVFTLDSRLIISRAGTLALRDRRAVRTSLDEFLRSRR